MQVVNDFRYVASSLLLLLVCLTLSQAEARNRHSSKEPQAKCQTPDECKLGKQQYALYAFVKRALDSKFDLVGKELIPFIKSVDVLRKRYQGLDHNETSFIRNFIADERINNAIELFKSDTGSNLIELYRSSINGKDQNLACSEFRLRSLERATILLDNNQELAKVFAKIHRNFAKKSAKRCLKHACSTIDTNMSELDSVLPAKYHAAADDDKSGDVTRIAANESTTRHREFEKEELRLCHFLSRTNMTDCRITGAEMKEIDLSRVSSQRLTSNRSLTVEDLLKAYYTNVLAIGLDGKEKSINNEAEQMQLASRTVLQESCGPLRRQLEYHLAALKWYQELGYIDKQKLNSRAVWCPSLSYWLQVDRVCHDLETSLDTYLQPIFEYAALDSDKSRY